MLFGVASLSGVDVRPDQRKIEPLMLATDEPAMVAAQGKVMSATGRQSSLPRVFVFLRDAEQTFPAKIEALGGTVSPIHARLFSGAIPRDAARYLSRWPEVTYIESEKLARPMLDLSLPAVSAKIVHLGTGLPAAYDGTGTYVGVVDTGLSSGHLDFFVNGNPSLSRIAHWYPNETIAGVDTSWHGTHVTGIAAGNGFLSGGHFTGMAPGADLLVAKTTFTTVDIQNGVANLLTFAGTTPVAINLSLGLMTGPHDGSSGFESGLGFYATNGVSPDGKQILSAAAGNERTHKEHFQSVLPPFGSVTASLSLEAGSSFIDVWADGEDRYTVTATLSGGESATAPTETYASSPGVSIYNRTDAPPNGATHISVFFSASAATSASILLSRTRNGGNGKVDAYVDLFEGNFSVGTQAGTITEPANAEDVIAVGSFETKTPGGSPAVQNISSFSSLGPTRDGREKPDLTAPGTILYSAKSLDPYQDPPPEPQTVPGEPDYIIEQGTSMSTPHVAGIAALVWESNSNLTGAQMRERLKRTASAPTDGSGVPNMTWGYGKVNALSAITETVAGISGPLRALPGEDLILRADEKSSGPYGDAVTYSWSAPGATVTPLTGPSTTFTANTSGDYPVTLTAAPGSAPYNIASATIRVNNVPTASISGPAAVDNVTSIPFAGTGMDADAQQSLSFHWILLARPSGSASVLTTANVDNVTLVPDVSGTYELGLRVNDGMDDSALATHTVAVTLVTSSSGGGGGCSVVNGKGEDDAASTVAALLLLLSPLGVLCTRKREYRFPRQCLRRSPPRR